MGFKKDNWPIYIMIFMMFICGCKVLEIQFENMLTIFKYLLTVVLIISYTFSSIVLLKRYSDCEKDLINIRRTMNENNSNCDNKNKDFIKMQFKNAENLEKAYLKKVDFVKDFSSTTLKYCAAFAAIWLKINF